jgi:hypothetical protein
MRRGQDRYVRARVRIEKSMTIQIDLIVLFRYTQYNYMVIKKIINKIKNSNKRVK